MNIFENLFKNLIHPNKPTPPQPNIQAAPMPGVSPYYTTKNYKVAGVTHYEKSILKFALGNPYYTKSAKEIIAAKLYNQNIYEYNFLLPQTELIPEPTNQYDPNAIKVVIGGVHVGYIKAGSCKHVLKLIAENRINKIDCSIMGGAYKRINFDGEDYKEEKGQNKYGIEISIAERQ